MDGAKIGKNCIILPGSIVSLNKAIPDNQVWGGCPAKLHREVTDIDLHSIQNQNQNISEYSNIHANETRKSWQEILLDEEDNYQIDHRQDYYFGRKTREEHQSSYLESEESKYPGRIFNSPCKYCIKIKLIFFYNVIILLFIFML